MQGGGEAGKLGGREAGKYMICDLEFVLNLIFAF
jgi:hypothetical protein